ncbi:alpha/beta fold hydrolase [Demetria terragena]|uniref:alpha/beta fold hydrolase n=1 Tax=Demetria terragena TaxID=63959 RepID=UPI000367830B|nr:alpha/beta hydrolase [Demetria terragena]
MTLRLLRDLDGIAVEIHEATNERSAVPVLLLHGIGGSAATFSGVAPQLAAAGWRTLAWDAPGYGASRDPESAVTGEDSPGAYVDLVGGLLSALGAPRVHIAGVSWGGVIATHVAIRHPDLIASLTLIDSTRGSSVTPERAASMRERVSELADLGGEAFAARRAPRLLAAEAETAVLNEVTRQMAAVRPPGYAGAAEMMAQSDTGPHLSQVSVPTLVVVGDEDRVTGVEESRLLAREIHRAEFALIKRAGHAAIQERPEEIASVMDSFLTQADSMSS